MSEKSFSAEVEQVAFETRARVMAEAQFKEPLCLDAFVKGASWAKLEHEEKLKITRSAYQGTIKQYLSALDQLEVAQNALAKIADEAWLMDRFTVSFIAKAALHGMKK